MEIEEQIEDVGKTNMFVVKFKRGQANSVSIGSEVFSYLVSYSVCNSLTMQMSKLQRSFCSLPQQSEIP